MLRNLYNIVLIIFLFSTEMSFSQTEKNESNIAIDISTIGEDEFIGNFLHYFEDAKHELNRYTIKSQKFIPVNKKVINFGFSTSIYWLKFSVINKTEKEINRLLYIQKPLQDSITLFSGNDKNIIVYTNGYMVKEEDKLFNASSLYFPIQLKPNSLETYYLKINSKYGKAIAANLIKEKTLYKRETIELIAVCILIGALLTIAFYNLFLGYSLKDWLYPIYATAVIGSLATQLTARGFMKLYLVPEHRITLEWSPPFFIAFGTIALSFFCIKFLNTKKHDKISHIMLCTIVYYMIAAFIIEVIILEFFNIPVTNTLVAVGLMLFGFIALISGIRVYKKGNKSALYFIYAWTIYCITIVLYIFTLLAWIPINAITNNAYMVGSILEALLLSLALGDRYNQLKKEKNQLISRLVVKEEDINAKKQEIINLMTESIQQLKNKAKLAENLKKLSKEEEGVSLREILTDLRSHSFDDSKSILIKENILDHHTEFIEVLKKKHPDLSKTDIELAIFSKLKLSRKEISELRGTTIEAVKRGRARLKKKLDLPPGNSLKDYVDNI